MRKRLGQTPKPKTATQRFTHLQDLEKRNAVSPNQGSLLRAALPRSQRTRKRWDLYKNRAHCPEKQPTTSSQSKLPRSTKKSEPCLRLGSTVFVREIA
jgi:hypothetical protein